MDKKWVIALLTPLIVICAAQSVYIYQQRQAQKRMLDPWAGLDQWMSQANLGLFSGEPVPFRDFDKLFNDRFFGRSFDPFRAIEGFPERFDSLLTPENRPLFKQSWRDWFQSRMDTTDINPDVKTTKEQVIISLKIPGLQQESLNVNVDKDRIKVSYNAKNSEEKKDKDGHVIQKSESVQQFEKIMPVPPEADPNTAQITKDGDKVQITFKKKVSGVAQK